MIGPDNRLTIDLYHGTSTLFLDSIVQNGLAGINPVQDWNLVDLCKEVYDLSEQHLKTTELFERSAYSLKLMAEQNPSSNSSFNYQHGETYVSPSKMTAIRYATKKYGSEMLTYTIEFLNELLKQDIPYVKSELYRKYHQIFGFILAAPSPLLIQVKNVKVDSLLSEQGDKPDSKLEFISKTLAEVPEMADSLLQQTNFRLIQPVEVSNLKIYIVNVKDYNGSLRDYNLYEIHPEPIIS